MELFHANAQWSTRPADERFLTLDAMYEATKAYAGTSKEKMTDWGNLRVEGVGNDLNLIGKAGLPARVSNYAFTQLCTRTKAPAEYLRALPSQLAAQNLNYGLKERSGTGAANLLFHRNGDLLLRAATTEHYKRIWNWEVIDRLRDAAARHNLVPAMPTFRQMGNDAPALYASDHDMFAFMMSKDRVVRDVMKAELFRGVIVINSEVGDKALRLLGFYFREICGNHIIWGAEEIAKVRLAHVGEIQARWKDAMLKVRKYLDSDTTLEKARFAETTVQIAGTKDEVLDILFGKRFLRRHQLESSYAAVVPAEDGNPNTVWGFAQGITRFAQTVPFADERTELDRAAGKLLDFDF